MPMQPPVQPPSQPPSGGGKGLRPSSPAQPPSMSTPSTTGLMPSGGQTDFNALAQSMAGPNVAPQVRPGPASAPGMGGFGFGGMGGFGFGGMEGLLGGVDINALMQMYQQQPTAPPASMIPQNLLGPMGMMY